MTKPTNRLPANITRCNGVGYRGDYTTPYIWQWREGCERCLRRVAPRRRCVMMPPPPLVDGKCEYLIEVTATINDLAAQQGVRQVTNIDTLRTVDADPLELQRHIDELRQVDGSYCQRRQNDQNKAAP